MENLGLNIIILSEEVPQNKHNARHCHSIITALNMPKYRLHQLTHHHIAEGIVVHHAREDIFVTFHVLNQESFQLLGKAATRLDNRTSSSACPVHTSDGPFRYSVSPLLMLWQFILKTAHSVRRLTAISGSSHGTLGKRQAGTKSFTNKHAVCIFLQWLSLIR